MPLGTKRLKLFDIVVICLSMMMLIVGFVIPANNAFELATCTLLALIVFPVRYVLWEKSMTDREVFNQWMSMSKIAYYLALILFIMGMWLSFFIPGSSLEFIIRALALVCIIVYGYCEKRVEDEYKGLLRKDG